MMLVSVTATHFIKRTHSQPLRNGKLRCELKDTRRGSWSSSMGYCHTQQEYGCDAHIEVRNGTMTAGACRVCQTRTLQKVKLQVALACVSLGYRQIANASSV